MQLHTMFGEHSPIIVTAIVAFLGIGGGALLSRFVLRWFDRMIDA